MKVKYRLPFFAILLALCGCTLTLDESDLPATDNKPVSGDGKTSPMIKEFDEGRIELQLAEGVRLLGPEYQRYVLRTDIDTTDAKNITTTYFTGDIPADMLPAKGDSVIAEVPEMFPTGLADVVLFVEKANGGFKMTSKRIPPTKFFKVLKCNLDFYIVKDEESEDQPDGQTRTRGGRNSGILTSPGYKTVGTKTLAASRSVDVSEEIESIFDVGTVTGEFFDNLDSDLNDDPMFRDYLGDAIGKKYLEKVDKLRSNLKKNKVFNKIKNLKSEWPSEISINVPFAICASAGLHCKVNYELFKGLSGKIEVPVQYAFAIVPEGSIEFNLPIFGTSSMDTEPISPFSGHHYSRKDFYLREEAPVINVPLLEAVGLSFDFNLGLVAEAAIKIKSSGDNPPPVWGVISNKDLKLTVVDFDNLEKKPDVEKSQNEVLEASYPGVTMTYGVRFCLHDAIGIGIYAGAPKGGSVALYPLTINGDAGIRGHGSLDISPSQETTKIVDDKGYRYYPQIDAKSIFGLYADLALGVEVAPRFAGEGTTEFINDFYETYGESFIGKLLKLNVGVNVHIPIFQFMFVPKIKCSLRRNKDFTYQPIYEVDKDVYFLGDCSNPEILLLDRNFQFVKRLRPIGGPSILIRGSKIEFEKFQFEGPLIEGGYMVPAYTTILRYYAPPVPITYDGDYGYVDDFHPVVSDDEYFTKPKDMPEGHTPFACAFKTKYNINEKDAARLAKFVVRLRIKDSTGKQLHVGTHNIAKHGQSTATSNVIYRFGVKDPPEDRNWTAEIDMYYVFKDDDVIHRVSGLHKFEFNADPYDFTDPNIWDMPGEHTKEWWKERGWVW